MKNYIVRDASNRVLTGDEEIVYVKNIIEKHVAVLMAKATAGLPKPAALRESKPMIATLQEERAHEEEIRCELYRKAIAEGRSEAYARSYAGGRDHPHWAPQKAIAAAMRCTQASREVSWHWV